MVGTYPANLGKGGAYLYRLKEYLDELWAAVDAGGDAENVAVADTGGNFTAEDVEAVLAEIWAKIQAVAGADPPTQTVDQNALDLAVLEALNPPKLNTAGHHIQYVPLTLAGRNPSRFNLGAAVAATVTGTNQAPFDLAAGQTFIVDPDGNGDETATFDAAAGIFTGDAGASEDISGGVDNKLSVAVDGDVDGGSYQEITLTLAGANTGNLIAAEIETQIQALGGIYAAVTCAFDTDHYVVTSGTLGTDSKVRFATPASGSLAEELKLSETLGTPTDGTGDVANIDAVTIDEALAVLNADVAGVTFTDDGNGAVVATSDTTGHGSSLTIGAGTGNTGLGFTQSAYYGSAGLGLTDLGDANYLVWLQSKDETTAGNIPLVSVHDKATDGFQVTCSTADYAGDFDALLVGLGA